MEDYERKFDKNKIHSVELNLLDGQVELILFKILFLWQKKQPNGQIVPD